MDEILAHHCVIPERVYKKGNVYAMPISNVNGEKLLKNFDEVKNIFKKIVLTLIKSLLTIFAGYFSINSYFFFFHYCHSCNNWREGNFLCLRHVAGGECLLINVW